jgi:hypothetical protein
LLVVFIFLLCDALDLSVLCSGVPRLRVDFGFSLVSISDLDYRTVLFPVRGPDLLFSFSLLVFFSRSREELLIHAPAQGLWRFFRFPSRFACQAIFFYFGFTVARWEFLAPVFFFRADPVPDFFLSRAEFWCKL